MTKHYQNNLYVNSIHEHPSKLFINNICIIEMIRYVYRHLFVCKGFQSFKRTKGRNVTFFYCVLLNLDLTLAYLEESKENAENKTRD